jgi:hypothetical protein
VENRTARHLQGAAGERKEVIVGCCLPAACFALHGFFHFCAPVSSRRRAKMKKSTSFRAWRRRWFGRRARCLGVGFARFPARRPLVLVPLGASPFRPWLLRRSPLFRIVWLLLHLPW